MPPSKKRCVQCTAESVDCTHCLCTGCAFCSVRVARSALVICGNAREGGSSGGQRCRSCRRARKLNKGGARCPMVPTAPAADIVAPVAALLSSILSGGGIHPAPSASAPPNVVTADAIIAEDVKPHDSSHDANRMRTRSSAGPRQVNTGNRRSCRGVRLLARRGGLESMSAGSDQSSEEGIGALCDLVAKMSSGDDSPASAPHADLSPNMSLLERCSGHDLPSSPDLLPDPHLDLDGIEDLIGGLGQAPVRQMAHEAGAVRRRGHTPHRRWGRLACASRRFFRTTLRPGVLACGSQRRLGGGPSGRPPRSRVPTEAALPLECRRRTASACCAG